MAQKGGDILLEASNLGLPLGSMHALRGSSVRFRGNEIFSTTSPNGAGKALCSTAFPGAISPRAASAFATKELSAISPTSAASQVQTAASKSSCSTPFWLAGTEDRLGNNEGVKATYLGGRWSDVRSKTLNPISVASAGCE